MPYFAIDGSAFSFSQVLLLLGLGLTSVLLAALVLYVRQAVLLMAAQRDIMQFLLLNNTSPSALDGLLAQQQEEGQPMSLSSRSFIRPALLYSASGQSSQHRYSSDESPEDDMDVLVEFDDVSLEDLSASEQFNAIPLAIQEKVRAFHNVIDNLQARLRDEANPSLASDSN